MAEIDLKPTESMASNAERGLELREKHGKGGTAIGVARARDIKNRANLSPETVRRMHAFFNRHEKNKSGGEDDAGYIAWLLWGGDSGRSWAASKVKQLDRKEENGMSDTYKEINARLGALGKSTFAEASDRYGDALMKPITKANAKAMERLAVEAIKHAKKVGDDDLLELAEEVGREVQALRSRASRPGAKATFDEHWRPNYEQRAADRINIAYGLMSKCEDKQREIAKTIKALEKAINDMRNAVRRKDSTLLYDTEDKISDLDRVRSSFSRPGAKATMAAINPQAINIAKNVIAYPKKYASMSPDERDRIGKILERLEDDASFDGNGEVERLASKAIALMIAHSITAKNRARSNSSRPGAKAKFASLPNRDDPNLEHAKVAADQVRMMIKRMRSTKQTIDLTIHELKKIWDWKLTGTKFVVTNAEMRPGDAEGHYLTQIYFTWNDEKNEVFYQIKGPEAVMAPWKPFPGSASSVAEEVIRLSGWQKRSGGKAKNALADACWKGYEAVGTKQKDGKTVPNCVPKDANAIREGDEAKFGDVGSDDNKIRYLLGEAESAIQHNAGMSTAAGFVKKAEALVQDKTPADLRSRIQRVKSMMKDSNAVRKGKKVAR